MLQKVNITVSPILRKFYITITTIKVVELKICVSNQYNYNTIRPLLLPQKSKVLF